MTVGDQESVICFGTYNIWNRGNGRIELELWGVAQSNIDLGFFQETKVRDGIHTHVLVGYHIFATNTPIRNSGGVAVFYWNNATHFQVKSIQQHELNVLRLQVDSGGGRWFIVG